MRLSARTQTKNLTDQVHRRSGFVVHCHASGRDDLNDFRGSEAYVRGSRGLKPGKDACLISRSQVVGHVMCNDELDFDVAAYAPLNETKSGIGYEPRKILGLLGMKREVRTSIVVPQPVSDFIDTHEDANAGLIQMLIRCRGRIQDSVGRLSPRPPTLIIVTPLDLCNEIITHLASNPKEYYELVRMMLPESEFPNINRNILGRISPGSGLLLLPGWTLPPEHNQRGLSAETYQKYGTYYPY